MTKIASVCMPADPRDKQGNIANMERFIGRAGAESVDLLVFPELVVTGYGLAGMQQYSPEDKTSLKEFAEYIPDGPTTEKMIEHAARHRMHISWGMTEKDPDRAGVIYNTTVLVGPNGYIGKYRKTHQPLCERLLLFPGSEEPPVFDTEIGKIGLEICFDKFFPEVTRTLALKGAEIVLGPTLHPNMSGEMDDPDQVIYDILGKARAAENMVVFVDSNQCGPCLAGHSQILGPNPGQVFASTGFEEGMAVADVDVQGEIFKAKTVSLGGSDLLKDRKPHMYQRLVEPDCFSPLSAYREEA